MKTISATKRNAGIALIWVLTVLPPAIIAALSPIKKSHAWRAHRPAFSPPGVVFAVVWPLLYVAAASAMMLQVFWAEKRTPEFLKWTALALVATQLLIGFFWPVVWNSGRTKEAAFIVLLMLAFLVPGIIATAKVNTVAACLWAPMAVWLLFALLLSTATVQLQRSKEFEEMSS